MTQKGRHSFTIPKADTPARSSNRPSKTDPQDVQARLRQMGHFSRNNMRYEAWPSKPESVR